MEQQQLLVVLFNKYLENQCSPENVDRLFELLDKGEAQSIKEELIRQSLSAEIDHPGNLNPALKEKLEQRLKIIQNKIHDPEKKGKVLSIGLRLIAVAVIILLLGLGSFFVFFGKNENSPVSVKKVPLENDMAPGGDKAILTLADGRRIVLDTVSNGAIASEGGIKVIKLGGQLIYDSENSTAGVLYNTISTPRGGQYQLELGDGTRVWLNSASSLRFPTSFSGKDRRVQLTGEGYFEVAHNSSMPFIVEKGDTRVQVLGTHFNINAYDDEADIKVTLLEGSVNVSHGITEKMLRPGQQARITSEVQVISGVNIEKVIAWKNGWFEFDETGLSAIMRQVSRWYDVDIVYAGRSSEQEFGGRISRKLPLSAVLGMLQNSGVTGFRLEGKKLFVEP